MLGLADIAAQAAHNAPSLWQSLWDGSWTSATPWGGILAGLALFWRLQRFLRNLISTVFMLCVIYLTVKLGMGIDLAEKVRDLLGN
ncbi:MAG: hypothetical protein ACI4OZ_01100 [Akkermansia sp.]